MAYMHKSKSAPVKSNPHKAAAAVKYKYIGL